LAFEPAPANRTTLNWLLRRNFRTGQTHATRLLSRHRGAARLAQIGLAGAKGSACLAGAAAAVLSPVARRRWLVRGSLHAGVAARLAGMKVLELY
jgi:succinoglycan biosynthesis protein ExoM